MRIEKFPHSRRNLSADFLQYTSERLERFLMMRSQRRPKRQKEISYEKFKHSVQSDNATPQKFTARFISYPARARSRSACACAGGSRA
jgi:hypothetical protein